MYFNNTLLYAALHAILTPLGQHQAYRSGIQWGPCNPSVQDRTLSCSSFKVSLDYHDPSVGYANLSLIKANATGDRRGTVFMNPGGPGVSGVQDLDATSALLLNVTGGDYDIVSWDPRGVGQLTFPGDVFCFDSVNEYTAFFNDTIELRGIEMTGNFTDSADVQELLSQATMMQEKYTELGQRCLQHSSGKYLSYTGTAATARDLVALADALDGPGNPINYYGLSYGTILGSWFINMFPERVGRVILDGVVDPVGFSQEDIALGWEKQLVDADKAYEGFFTGCALAGPEGCSFASPGQSPLDVNANIQNLLKTAHDAARANTSAPVTSGQIQAFLRTQMYIPAGWGGLANTTLPQFAQQVKDEAQGSGAMPSGPIPRRIHSRAENETTPFTTAAIICGDSGASSSTMQDVFEGIISASHNISSMFASAWPFATFYCPFWPVRAVERYEGPFNKTLANSILVIGNTFDPATPFVNAKTVADAHGTQAALVRLNAFGHTSQAEPSTCIGDIVRDYMVNGKLPEGDDTVCEVDDSFEVFPGVNTPTILANMPSISI